MIGMAIALVFATADCDRSSQPPPERQLTGARWTVTSMPEHDPLPPGSFLDATFLNGTIRGSDGCNSYGGPYSTTYGGGFHINGLESTSMGCSGPVTDLETAYTDALGKASFYQVNGDSLTLKDARGTALVLYGANAPPPITGLKWQAYGYRDGPVNDKQAIVTPIPNTTITVVFGTDGILTGSFGCNAYTAAFTITGGRMEIGSPTSEGTCSQKVMDQERAYLVALGSTARWHFSGPSFQLLNDTGKVEVTFAPA